MDVKMGGAATHMNSYEPASDLIEEEDCDTLLLYLPGFKKEQLRVQLSGSRMLRISGTRPVGDDKLSSFQKDYPVSANCDTNNITAKFEGGILYVRQPKLIIPAEKGDGKLPPSETPQPQKPVEEPPVPPAAPPPRAAKEKQEQDTTKKTTPSEDQIKQPRAKDLPDQSVQKAETKPEEEKGDALEGAKRIDKNSAQEKTSSIDDDHKAVKSTSDRREKFSGNIDSELANKRTKTTAKSGVGFYKLGAGSVVPKLNMSKQMMSMILAVILAFAFGMYVNNLIWKFSKPKN